MYKHTYIYIYAYYAHIASYSPYMRLSYAVEDAAGAVLPSREGHELLETLEGVQVHLCERWK